MNVIAHPYPPHLNPPQTKSSSKLVNIKIVFSLGSLTAPLAKTAPPKDRRRAHRRRGASDFEKLVATGARMGLIRGNHPIIKYIYILILYFYYCIIYICPKHSETLFMHI